MKRVLSCLLFLCLWMALFLPGCGGSPVIRELSPSAPLEREAALRQIGDNGESIGTSESAGAASAEASGEDDPTLPDGRVHFLGAGDVLIHEAVFTDAMARATALAATTGYRESYEFTGMFDGVKEIVQAADVSFVNFECPIAGDRFGARGYPNFNAPEASGRAIVEMGFDVVNVANNHMLDMDPITTGLKNTVEFWKSQPVLTVGGYTEGDRDELRILERNGIKIAFLSYTYGTNIGDVNSTSSEYLVPSFRESRMEAQVKAARNAADFVVVSMHWGDETSYATDVTKANNSQKKWAQKLCDWGADAIIGTHPHVIQDVEWYESGAHKMLCYYSLGNFISTQYPYSNLVGGFASFDIVRGEDGVCRAENPALIPNATYYSKTRDSLAVLLLEDMTEGQVSSHGSQLRIGENGRSSYSLGDLYKLVQMAVTKEFLPSYLQ